MKVHVAVPDGAIDTNMEELREIIRSGRIPVSEKNIRVIPVANEDELSQEVARYSSDADLVLMGMPSPRDAMKDGEFATIRRCPELSEVLFVRAAEAIVIE